MCVSRPGPDRRTWRPSFGTAEDRNVVPEVDGKATPAGGGRPSGRPRIATFRSRQHLLTVERRWRPSFGTAEDRNATLDGPRPALDTWRPSFGTAEDRNFHPPHSRAHTGARVAAVLRDGRGSQHGEPSRARLARSHVAAVLRDGRGSQHGPAGPGEPALDEWRPSFGTAEDRNQELYDSMPDRSEWQPSFGTAEDRNTQISNSLFRDPRGGRPSGRPRIAT
ncbi:UNVERIFIED_ORG: hypothetical protein CLV66_103297 [Actinomadura viridilutea]